MRAALRRRKKGRSTQITHTHTHTQREREEREENNPERARGWSRGGGEIGGKEFGKKRINIDRFWKVRRRGRRTVICSRSQDARWGKKKKKNSGKA